MSGIDTAVILAAGEGSRLRPLEPYKPLCKLGGKTLLDHAAEGLAAAGIGKVVVVTGYGAEAVEAHIVGRAWPVPVETVRTTDWRLPNGVSARAAAPLLAGAPTLLVMCDHFVDPGLYKRVRRAGPGPGLRLGIDRRLGHPFVDPDDVTCVRTEGDRIVAIGKGLEPHNAYDTGVFALGPPFFEVLAELDTPSLTEGVRRLSEDDAAEIIDCSDLDWIDVDDPAALAKAQEMIASTPCR